MANYSGTGGHAMETKCPYCSNVGANLTLKTWPRYSRKARASAPLRDATDRAYFSRCRTRACCACGRQFETHELSGSDLWSFKSEHGLTAMHALLTQSRIAALEEANQALTAEITALRQKQNDVSARVMNNMAELRDREISRSTLTLVRHS